MTSTKLPSKPVAVVGGGQSGLATAWALQRAGMRPIVLEASDRATGSWPRYYDSLTLFSPAEYSAMPGVPWDGDRSRYPRRDEVVAYLERFAATLDVEIRTNARVGRVEPGFVVHTEQGDALEVAGIVAASGSFGNPHRPDLPGLGEFGGEVLHVADYRSPDSYAGKRIVIVGGGNSAVQVGYELGKVATVTLATRTPLRFLRQSQGGHDLHYWLRTTGFDDLPPAWLARLVGGTLVVDDGAYGRAEKDGIFDRRPMFARLDERGVVWTEGQAEPVDVVLLATGYRPNLPYLRDLGALDADGIPLHDGGISLTHPGLAYAGLEFQRSFASNTLRGVSRDAEYVVRPLAAHVGGAGALLDH
jgi:putative flavoprotein involved in K+ transport